MPEPGTGKVLDLGNRFKQIMSQPVVSNRSVGSLNVGVLLRVPRLGVSIWISRSFAHCLSTSLMYSGPLSQRIASGLPRHHMMFSSTRVSRTDGNDRSTSIARPSRLKSSMTFNNRHERPSESWSCIKSMDQDWFIRSGTDSAWGFSRTMRFLGLMRRFSSYSRSIRKTRLWFHS